MRYIFFTFSFKKSFDYKAFFFPYENILSANNVYFAKFFFFFNLVLQQMNNNIRTTTSVLLQYISLKFIH